MTQKSIPQVTLEVIMRKNKEAADSLYAEAQRLLNENRELEVEQKRLTVPPPRVSTKPPPPEAPNYERVLFFASRLVKTWDKRHKTHYTTAEADLRAAVEAYRDRQ